MLNLFHNSDFIFNCPYAFRDRFDGRENIFARDANYLDVPESVQRGHEPFPANLLETNLIADARTLPLIEYKKRGGKGTIMYFEMADATLAGHISEFPVGTYKKAHRHGPGAHVIILTGAGYSLIWQEGEKPMRIDWQPGSMLVPPEMWFHQHFNTGSEPARYLVFHIRSRKYRVFRYYNKSHVSTKEGGHQIEYRDESPEIRKMFEQELRRNGVECQMPESLYLEG
jgi:oxalate decarboxylase/phosphoglucose isomerase-like protein (cupin superfamily)